MPNMGDELNKTLTRIARRGDSQPRAQEAQTVATPDTRTGRLFGVYRIIRRLGAGGMGQVYLAIDTRLERYVALKFLPSELAADYISLQRLQQEAQAASALNHPNILTIYDVGQADGEPFIVSEFVDGITLRAVMDQNTAGAYSPVDIAIQIASALSAAHTAGVIHRDLKPSNIMLRPDGYVKVIDFGLAKITRLAETDSGLTRPGSTLGTADYMSPEQARGEELDPRTDLWSLGIVLYEMVAGRRPFEGPTLGHVLVAIQDQPLPELSTVATIPPAVCEIVTHALAKKPEDRYASAAEMLHALQAISGPTAPRSHLRPAVQSSPTGIRLKPALLVLAATIVLFACAFAWWRMRQPHWLQLSPLRQLTFSGRTRLAVMSPDGKYLAYSVGEPDGQQALHLTQIDSLTDQPKILPRKVNYHGLTFSPDSQRLYVVEKDEAYMGRLYVVPVLGARSPNPLVTDVDGPISFSPSRDQFAFVRYETGAGREAGRRLSRLMVSSVDGQSMRQLISVADALLFRQPVWSPDGKHIAVFLFKDSPHSSGQAFLDLVGLDGSESRRFIPDWRAAGQPQWTADGKSLIVSGVSTFSHPEQRFQLHQISVSGGEDHLLTNDLAAYREVSLSSESGEMAAIKEDSKAVVWVSQHHDFARVSGTIRGELELNPSLAWADANHLIVNSRRGGNGYPNLGVWDAEGQSFSPFTNERCVEQDAAVIPGSTGKAVVFSSNRSGQFHIWRFDADNNKLRQLTYGANDDVHPSVSPDGKWIVYTSWQLEHVPDLLKIPAEGGSPVQVVSYAEWPQISPDGKAIACFLHDSVTDKWAVTVVPFGSSGAPHAIAGAAKPFTWSPAGDALVSAITDAKGVSNLWRFPLDGSAPSQLTRFEDQTIAAFSWSPSGDRLACLRSVPGSDVELFKTRDKQ